MCDPVSIGVASAGLAVSVTGDILKAKAEKNQAKQTVASAKLASVEEVNQLSLRENQEQDAAGQSILQADRAARLNDATARVSAGEAGVAGASVDALLNDIQRQNDEFKTNTNINLQNDVGQIEEQKRAARVDAQNRINSVPFPSSLATGLQIGGDVLGAVTPLLIRKRQAGSVGQ